MKQTAVEWLIDELTLNQPHKWVQEVIEQAKEMEKNQIIDSYRDGRSDQQSDRPSKFYNRMAEQYYNETFKSE
jgi:HEPN domain-containing protein